jgi:LmbE family N-acetylglucosaminyl deacetylase
MQLNKPTAEVYIPDNGPVEDALSKVTHLAIAAHQDDIEIMALDGILSCWNKPGRGFAGVVMTDGAGSPRDGVYSNYTDLEMRQVRHREQKKAAYVGEYRAVAFLEYSSAEIKNPDQISPVEDLKMLLHLARPEVVYTHNPADKHDTHVAVLLRTLSAIRALPVEERPRILYGCEVWRGLDWMLDTSKKIFSLDGHENLAVSLVGLFDSQVAGGKRYDLASQGRWRANATYLESHATDEVMLASLGIDLTPLIVDNQRDVNEFIQGYIQQFAEDVSARLKKFS